MTDPKKRKISPEVRFARALAAWRSLTERDRKEAIKRMASPAAKPFDEKAIAGARAALRALSQEQREDMAKLVPGLLAPPSAG